MGKRDACGSSDGCPDSEDKTWIDGRADGAIPSDRPDSSNICSVVGALMGALVVSSPMSTGGRPPDDGLDVVPMLLPASPRGAKVGILVSSSPPPPLPSKAVGT